MMLSYAPFTVTSDPAKSQDAALLAQTSEACSRLRQEVGRVIVGQDAVLEHLIVALLTQGHALLVGVPGLAKTLLVSSLSRALDLSFGRVQFTPDLLPADITGTDVLSERDGRRELSFLPGPIFKNLVLADEINRTPPKTQAALLQAMQERAVTVGGATHPLPGPFQVFATRNPIEQEGTYALPEAQLDRFLLEVHVEYPSEDEERKIARRTTSGSVPEMARVLAADELRMLQAFIPRVPVTDQAVELAVRLARATRPAESASPEVKSYVRFGSGPRGSQALVLAAKAHAAMRGEAAADVEDVLALALPALRHRLVLSYRAEVDGVKDADVVAAVTRLVRV
ncbi:MAG TPA: MoxR family ATPase [Polyangiaceae bacterium]|nr:MoxR family ATPase [Polyangiaceae bacterium]